MIKIEDIVSTKIITFEPETAWHDLGVVLRSIDKAEIDIFTNPENQPCISFFTKSFSRDLKRTLEAKGVEVQLSDKQARILQENYNEFCDSYEKGGNR